MNDKKTEKKKIILSSLPVNLLKKDNAVASGAVGLFFVYGYADARSRVLLLFINFFVIFMSYRIQIILLRN